MAAMTRLSWASLSTPVGPVSVGCGPAGVARVRYGLPPAGRPGPAGSLPDDDHPAARALAETASRELAEYFRGTRRVFDVPVDWTATTGVQRQVLTVLAAHVSYGHVISYGALARAAGLTTGDDFPKPPAVLTGGDDPPKPPAVLTGGDDPPKPPAGLPARTVGSVMAANPIPVIVPCHRVVASDGLGGYSGGAGIEVKRWLLILEGSLPPTLDWQPMVPPAG